MFVLRRRNNFLGSRNNLKFPADHVSPGHDVCVHVGLNSRNHDDDEDHLENRNHDCCCGIKVRRRGVPEVSDTGMRYLGKPGKSRRLSKEKPNPFPARGCLSHQLISSRFSSMRRLTILQ